MPNPATIPPAQDERIPGLPALPPGADATTLTVPVYYPGTDKTHQAPLAGSPATSNAVIGGPKFVRYRDSRLNGVPAGALTLDRLSPASIVPCTEATVANPANTPLTVTEAPKTYVAALVEAGTPGAVMVPAFIGAAASNTVPILWIERIVVVPGPNKRRDLRKSIRYWLKADRDNNEYGGSCFEDLDDALMALGTEIEVEFYRLSVTDPMRYNVTVVARYDANGRSFVEREGSFDGQRVPASFVLKDSPAAVRDFRRYELNEAGQPTITNWNFAEVCLYDDGNGDQFFGAQGSGNLSRPDPDADTIDWKRISVNDLPSTGGPGYTKEEVNALLDTKGSAVVQAQHTEQLATFAVQSSQVYGYLEAGGAPVGFGSLDASLADTRQKVFQTFNVATLTLTTSNAANGAGWAYATNAQGTTLTMAANTVLSLPGSDVGSLTFTDFYIQGARGAKLRLLTEAPTSVSPARLPRLSGYCGVMLELAAGGAVLLSGSYVSLQGTGTVYALQPFFCDNVAAGVTVVAIGGGGGDGYSRAEADALLARKADLDSSGKVLLSQVPTQYRFVYDYEAGQTQSPEYKILSFGAAGYYGLERVDNATVQAIYLNDVLVALDSQGRLLLAQGDRCRIEATAPAGHVGYIILSQIL